MTESAVYIKALLIGSYRQTRLMKYVFSSEHTHYTELGFYGVVCLLCRD
jgi:hypothetical protein